MRSVGSWCNNMCSPRAEMTGRRDSRRRHEVYEVLSLAIMGKLHISAHLGTRDSLIPDRPRLQYIAPYFVSNPRAKFDNSGRTAGIKRDRRLSTPPDENKKA
jgi:hypothetical protein